ncbi:MAG: HAMP domain-containing protein [Lachnospiraceae bacterium]|nr:HAMP domain-containing protein [Lachnospiraceae bacterium]
MKTQSHSGRKKKRSLSGKILKNTVLNILVLVIVCCVIMALSMYSLAGSILLDSLKPMARQSAKTVEANIHMLADRMMAIAADSRMNTAAKPSGEESFPEEEGLRRNREAVLTEAAEIYEFHAIALYSMEGTLMQGVGDAPESLDGEFFPLLKETDNLTIHPSTIFKERLGITMGIPVKQDGETCMYVVGVYKYDALNDVIGSINLGKNGMACLINRESDIVGHPDQSLVLSKSTLSQLYDGDDLAHAAIGETGAEEFTADGKAMLAAFSPVRGTQWALIIQVPKSDYDQLISQALLVAVLVTAAVLTVSILVVLRLSRSISRPVKAVTERMVSLADGDLHTETPSVDSGDELEILTRTLNATVERLNRYISDIRQVLTQIADGNLDVAPQVDYQGDFSLIQSSLTAICESMNGTISGFRAASAKLASMSEELSGQSGQLHQASLEQNQSAEALVQEVSHVKERLADVNENSLQTRAKTEEIAGRIQDANDQMSSLSRAMDDIRANTGEITKIAMDIEDIAFQTNILAINASIEAARAGAAGKGFAVVADEVRQLASKSAEAAQSATNMVTNTRAIIQTGVDLTANTADSLQAISGVSDQINAISDHLVAAVRSQESALGIMEERIGSISDIADRNLQNAGGTEQSSGLLADEAESLRSQAEKFILKEEHR